MKKAPLPPSSEFFAALRGMMRGMDEAEPMLTRSQRSKVAREILGLIGPFTSEEDVEVIRKVAVWVGRQTREEVRFCRNNLKGWP